MLRELKLANMTPEQKIEFLEQEKIGQANALKDKFLGAAFIVALIGASQIFHHSDSTVSAEVAPTATPYVQPTTYEQPTPKLHLTVTQTTQLLRLQ